MPVESLENLTWFKNTQGEKSVEVENAQNLSTVISGSAIAIKYNEWL